MTGPWHVPVGFGGGMNPEGHDRTRKELRVPRAIVLFPKTALRISEYCRPPSMFAGRANQSLYRIILLRAITSAVEALGPGLQVSQAQKPHPPPALSAI